MKIIPSLRSYIEQEIIPRYDRFDLAHQRNHVETVIEQSLVLARYYEVNINMVYAIAAYHDTGLCEDRKTHHMVSGRIVRADELLTKWFNKEDIETMAQAVEDHRASNNHAPRSIYGKIVAEADRLIDIHTILKRTIQYGLGNYPELSDEGQLARAIHHLKEKYGEGGYLKLWIPESSNAEQLKKLQMLIKDDNQLQIIFWQIYNNLKQD